MSDVLLQRLVAASHGRVPVDTLACPEWGYETVLFAARFLVGAAPGNDPARNSR